MTTSKAEPVQPKNTSGSQPGPLDLTIQRIPFAASVDVKMRTLKARTGITPNILARYGFCLSLEEGGTPANPFESEPPGRDINRNTLLGENDPVFIALLRASLQQSDRLSGCTPDEFNQLFIAHMNRGFELLSSRLRSLSDLSTILGVQVSKNVR